MRRKRIFFVHQGQRSFFERDVEILQGIAEVESFDNFPPSLGKFLRVLKGVFRSGIVFIWFMGRHAVWPLIVGKILGKKIILVGGGWDVANCPEIGYGLMRPGISSFIAKQLFRLPDMVLSVSTANHQELIRNVQIKKEKTKMVYHGFENKVSSQGPLKERMLITVGEVNQNNLKRKGLEVFVKVASHFPNVPFILIGRWASDGTIDFLKSIATANVQFMGHVTDQDLNAYMTKAMVYAQFSYHEAFGCALAEAMLHECVPVVTNQFALPEVVGDAGYLVPFGEVDVCTNAIRQALNDKTKGKIAREKILNAFSLESRRRALTQSINDISTL